MPLDNNTNSTTYVKTAYGRFLIADPQGDYEVKNKETGQVSKYRSFINLREFLLLSIELKAPNIERKFPAQWMINFVDKVEGHKYTLPMKVDSYVALGLINSLASIEDYTKPVTLSAYMKTDRTYVSAAYSKDSGKSYIRWKYEPKDIPAAVALARPDGTPFLDSNGYAVYDTKEKIEFFKKVVDSINEACSKDSAYNLVASGSPLSNSSAHASEPSIRVQPAVGPYPGLDGYGAYEAKPTNAANVRDHTGSFDDALPF
jgi:hypothetical protein